MKNYKAVQQWASTVTVEAALKELIGLKVKYPWLRCDESLAALERLSRDLPAIVQIIMLQEKQNAIHRKFIDLNKMADTAIIAAISNKFNLGVDGSD